MEVNYGNHQLILTYPPSEPPYFLSISFLVFQVYFAQEYPQKVLLAYLISQILAAYLAHNRDYAVQSIFC